MLTSTASWMVDEPVMDEPTDLLAIPEIRQHLVHEPHDDELGLRSLLETIEAPPPPGWAEDRHHGRRVAASRTKRPNLARAA